MVKISKQINKQHKHQSISGLEFQIHNFDIYTENLVLRPIHNNKSIYISFGSYTSLWKYIDIPSSKLEHKF